MKQRERKKHKLLDMLNIWQVKSQFYIGALTNYKCPSTKLTFHLHKSMSK